MRRDLPPRHRGSRCNLHAPAAPLHVITNNHRYVGPTTNKKNTGSGPGCGLLPLWPTFAVMYVAYFPACMWPPLLRRQCLLSLSITATSV
ncbi:hypothetical protein B296_00057481 [Ensete ventricosum]|uniref:Uncharacterized protein n=1 Tax=Ensete ventricosum TaxID=4639 RepID=A0A426X4A6_ENSVE|nr:hypothetical protein B296_00057481 [Ensete ventricosum]